MSSQVAGGAAGRLHVQITAVFAMELLLLLLGILALIACLWGLILCSIANGCCAPVPVAATATAVSC